MPCARKAWLNINRWLLCTSLCFISLSESTFMPGLPNSYSCSLKLWFASTIKSALTFIPLCYACLLPFCWNGCLFKKKKKEKRFLAQRWCKTCVLISPPLLKGFIQWVGALYQTRATLCPVMQLLSERHRKPEPQSCGSRLRSLLTTMTSCGQKAQCSSSRAESRKVVKQQQRHQCQVSCCS